MIEQTQLTASEVEAAQVRLYLARRRLTWPRLTVGMLALALAFVLGLATGPADIPLGDTLRILVSHLPGVHLAGSVPAGWDDIIWQVRLPRVLTAGVVGATLAMSGVTYQGVFRNPLAEPYLIGVASGAALGATIVIVSPLQYAFGSFSILPLAAFAGGLAAVFVTYAVARVGASTPMVTLVLAGVAVSSLATSLTSLLMILETNRVLTVLSWTLGGFNLSSWDRLMWALPYILPSLAVIFIFGRSLNVLQLDEEQAQQVGLEVERTRLLLLAAASLAAAAAVSISGVIGFVGLVVPHVTRMLWGPDHRQLLPMSMIMGATFLILADLLARELNQPSEVPVGIITAFCGAPFFLYMLRRSQRGIF